MSAGITIYYNVVTETMYDEKGAMMGNNILTAYFNNHLDLIVHYMEDTSADDLSEWIPWAGLAGKEVSSVVSFDKDYTHAVKGKSTVTSSGSTSINITVSVPEIELNYKDTLIAYRPDGSTITLPYNGFIYGSSSVEFLLEGTTTEDIPAGLNVRVPRSLYLKMQGDKIDNSLAAEGRFTFHTYLMSKKLLESLDYSDSEYLSGTMEHKIVFDGNVVRTFSFPFNITNLLDYNGEADVPETGNWASKEYVDSRIAASGGGGGGGGVKTVGGVSPDADGDVQLSTDNIVDNYNGYSSLTEGLSNLESNLADNIWQNCEASFVSKDDLPALETMQEFAMLAPDHSLASDAEFGVEYTAPTNGWVFWCADIDEVSAELSVWINWSECFVYSSAVSKDSWGMFPVMDEDTWIVQLGGAKPRWIKFVPCVELLV